MLTKDSLIGIVGSGAMGSGIAQVAASAGHSVIVFDTQTTALQKAEKNISANLSKLVEKQKISQDTAHAIQSRLQFTTELSALKSAGLIIEAIIENLEIKKQVFQQLEQLVSPECILASNTSSLSIASIAAACQKNDRVIGIHFFNPATLLPLVEIIPALGTGNDILKAAEQCIRQWGKTTVICKDTPGFIVNRIARPFYGEAMKIYEEGLADPATIDYAMRELGGFKMGPFELTDLIGHDVNYIVTETVWKQFYFDQRYRPFLCQKRLLEAGYLGRKSGKGFFTYGENGTVPAPQKDYPLLEKIFLRILSMLINEAVDALHVSIASAADIDTAMTKGVNYPKGLLAWCDEIGADVILQQIQDLRQTYQEDRYRPSLLLQKMAMEKMKIFNS